MKTRDLLATGIATLVSMAFCQSVPGERYLADLPGMSEYKIRKFETDSLGMTHTWADQYSNGTPVFGGEAIVHLNRDGSLSSVDNEAVQNLTAPKAPRLSVSEAVQAANNFALLNFGALPTAPAVVTKFVTRQNERDFLGYEVQLGRIDTRDDEFLPVIWVDAVTGAIIWSYDNLQTEFALVPTLYFGDQFIPVTFGNFQYYQMDMNRKLQVHSARDTKYDEYPVTSPVLSFNGPAWVGANDCYLNMIVTYEYFAQKHDWRGMDNNKGPGTEKMLDGNKGFTCVSDYGKPGSNKALNAFWDPGKKKAFFGGGFQNGLAEFVSCDVVGHELTHAVNDFTARMVYAGESGAMNESMSDIFGAMTERFRDNGTNSDTWLVGEDVIPGGIRDMLDPESMGQPDHKSECDFGIIGDNNGVHFNSGVPNRAFTLVAVGGNHTNNPTFYMGGIGEEKAERIWFRALRYHMGRVTTFRRALKATVKAAGELYGSNTIEQAAVRTAWEMCGVIE